MTPFVPFFLRSPCRITRQYNVHKDYGNGNTAIVTIVDYIDKKGQQQYSVSRLVFWLTMNLGGKVVTLNKPEYKYPEFTTEEHIHQ